VMEMMDCQDGSSDFIWRQDGTECLLYNTYTL